MKNVLLHKAIKRNEIRKRGRLWKKVVSAMALLVVFCTVYALVLPAITMGDEPVCGIEVHEHTDACYRKQISTMACPAAQHSHDQCEDALGNYTCGFGQTFLHSHGDNCYDHQRNLICQLEERSEHVHSDACWENTRVLSCTPEEQGDHTHGEECYVDERKLICAQEQIAVHTHTSSCYDQNGSRICGITPAAVHIHDEGCFSVIRLDAPELICSLEEHVHTEACYIERSGVSAAAQAFLCGFGVHQHADACYNEDGTLICTIPEHVHDASCKVEGYDATADVETAADWEAAVADAKLTGNWPLDILTIAQTQLGYQESKRNVYLYEDGSLKGYTRYGAWYGAPYIDWSAMFVSFCVNYAGAEAVPQDSSCSSYMTKLENAGMFQKSGYYLPKPGDLVFFDRNYVNGTTANADHMGIVAELLLGDNGELTKLKVLAGDTADQVQYVTCDLLDMDIIGYGVVPNGERVNYVCSEEAHAHTADCCEWKVYYTDDNMLVQAVIRGVEELPENLALEVRRITQANDPVSYGSMSAALNDWMTNTPYFLGETGIYQMRLLADGAVFNLPEGATTSVRVSFTQPVFSAQAVQDSVKMQTFELRATVETRDTYLVEALDGVSYENAQEGLTGIEFETSDLATFAVVLSDNTMTGDFWTRVTSTSELAAGGTFMIVSAEGNFALRGDNSNTYTPVTLEAVKGNTKYYTITSSAPIDANLYWTFSGSASSYTVRNQKTSNYVSVTRKQTGGSWLRPVYTEYVTNAASATLTLSYHTPENCWRFKNGSYYLRNGGTGAFGITNSSDGQYNSNAVYYYSRDMMIFKLSDVTAIEIPVDVTNHNDTSEGGNVGPAKPNYGDFIVPSGRQTDSTAVTDSQGNTVSGSYYSDPSTSDIETQFRQDSYEDSKINDGKVVTDKSVIYGKDDYGAFGSYPGNTFSVTLSALGQEYPVPEEHQVKVPVDVVFVLDVSGSMSTEGEEGRHKQRAVDMANAVNTAIGHIMEDHPANRIGVVLYSGGAWEMLPLSRYTASDGQYIIHQEKSITHSPTNVGFKITYVLGGNTLKDQYTKKSYAGVGGDAVQGIGTYTQAGIAMGHKVFNDIGDDTTYTTTMGEDESERSYTVNRQPVFILLSDGEPTYSTNVYNDVLNGPHYGDGYGGTPNGKGIHGYNTILSANYYKRMVGIQYQRPALFYTVGMSISPTDDQPMITTSYTSDTYKRAVLNPTVDMITTMTSSHYSASYTVDQLKRLLLGTFTDQFIDTRSNWPEKWTGIPHINVPVLHRNPYAKDFSYANGAYFGNLDEAALTAIFDDIYLQSSSISLYGFILYRDSSVDIVDRIGSGMEIKGTPVLRYGGQNYTKPEITVNGNVTTYTYHETFTDPYIPDRTVDLSRISITVTTDANGDQIVDFYIPDTALPVYTPELIGQQYYYESLPVRLIYQVGLTAESEQAVLNLQNTGGRLEFYTSKWDSDAEICTSTLLPSTANPFYYDADGDGSTPPYHEHHSLKTENTTHTVDYHVDCTRSVETVNGEIVVRVVHKQGNNGKLVFESDVVNIPVEKVWDGVNADIMNPVEISLYKVTEIVLENGGIKRLGTKVDACQIGIDNDWANVFRDIPSPNGEWYYAIVETVPAGYRVNYSGETIEITIDDGLPVTAAKVDLSNTENAMVTLTNSPAVRLPATGGMRVNPYTMGGILLIATACSALVYSIKSKRRREDSQSP